MLNRVLITSIFNYSLLRFKSLVKFLRRTHVNFIDGVIVLCAGLWNLNVICDIK